MSILSEWTREGKLKENCAKLHPLMFPFLQWLMATMRCHLKKLTPSEQIKEMNTTHQYYLASGTPEKEKKFQELKSKYGTKWGFHGSASCNWHAIMRKGLKNMSGTKGQINGAAYGSGVYLADDASTSFSYIRYQSGWPHSQFGSGNLGCIALCEIINHPDIKGQPNPY